MEGILAQVLAFVSANPSVTTFITTLLVNHGIKMAPIASNSIPELIGNTLVKVGTVIVSSFSGAGAPPAPKP